MEEGGAVPEENSPTPPGHCAMPNANVDPNGQEGEAYFSFAQAHSIHWKNFAGMTSPDFKVSTCSNTHEIENKFD